VPGLVGIRLGLGGLRWRLAQLEDQNAALREEQQRLEAERERLVTCYQLHVGRCQSCGRRVQPRHPGQTSDALGAASTQLGPRAVALASWLSKALGVRRPRTR
jgi:hypothetical protein